MLDAEKLRGSGVCDLSNVVITSGTQEPGT